MNADTKNITSTKLDVQEDTIMSDIATRNNTAPAKQGVTAISTRKVQQISRDALLRDKNMSALPATLAGLGILALFAGATALWMFLVPVNAVVSAQAEVVFKGKRQIVQHLEGGIIKRILIKDGDMVQAGQALIELEDKQVKPAARMVQEQNIAEKAQISRLEAEISGQRTLDSSGGRNKYAQTENRLFKAREEAHQNQIELMRTQISVIKESIRGSEERLILKLQENASLKAQLDANQRLLKDGYVSKSLVLDQQRGFAASSGELESIRSAIAGDKQRIAEIEQRIVTLKSERVQGAVSELKQSALRRIDQEERIRPLMDTLDRQVIRAPVSGRVVGLKVSTVGSTIIPRDVLMEIAPSGEALILEAKIEMKDINEVKVGQMADVTIQSFDARRTLPFRAKVTYISDDRIVPSPSSQLQPYYSAHLEFESDSLKDHSADKLIPGMTAYVSIAIAPRTAVDYLVEPLKESARKALQIR